ncbi:MAG TPA: four helix bundle protein [Candidatus Portnoybacteria bacterium]|nr:four helix bundle protein [Candidatus Portnoybacteria bacterium]
MQNDKSKFKKDFTSRLIRFSIKILKLSEKARQKRVLWSLVDQLIRSATSIGANVVEAKASSSKKDYIHFFEIALKSANETIYWLIIFKNVAPEFKNEIEYLYKEVNEISKILASSILTMKKRK